MVASQLGSASQAVGDAAVEVAGQYGTLTISADGSYRYARTDGSAGGVEDVFTYTLTDGDGDTVKLYENVCEIGTDEVARQHPHARQGVAILREQGAAAAPVQGEHVLGGGHRLGLLAVWADVGEHMRRYLEATVYQMVNENMASEQSARMVAMKAASDNAGKIINELQLIYNKTRQAAITKELSEIVGGAAAV